MIIDTSALIAIIRREPEAERFLDAIQASPARFMSTASFVEAAEVLARRFGIPDATEDLDKALSVFGIELVDFTIPQAKAATMARAVYGRGARHPANLNFGDCFTYGLAKVLDQPLMFKGDDFIHTDLKLVV